MSQYLISQGFFEENGHPFVEIKFANTVFKARHINDVIDYYKNHSIRPEHYSEFIQHSAKMFKSVFYAANYY